MASIGHVAVGMAAARVYHGGSVPRWPSLAAWSALSLLPDLDVIGFPLGVHYEDPWGHRGATHSFTLALAAGLFIGLAARWHRRPAQRLAMIATVVLASHAILDTMTDGGLGCALLWPFTLTRYFAPWRPIPVAPIGAAFFSVDGAAVALFELVIFSPMLLGALWPSRVRPTRGVGGGVIGVWLLGVWLVASDDRFRNAIVGFVVREDTAYASGFSDGIFRTISEGQLKADVRQRLGAPHGETWFYRSRDAVPQSATTVSVAALPHECRALRFENGIVIAAFDRDACKTIGVQTGTRLNDVEARMGPPGESCWQYSWSPRGTLYRQRMVCFSNERVEDVVRRWAGSE